MFGSIRYVSGEERASGTGTIEESVKHGSHSAVYKGMQPTSGGAWNQFRG